MKIRYIVELEPGVYLAPWLGDPPRTCVLVNSRWFLSKRSAAGAIVRARKYRPFLEARGLKVEVVNGIERIV
jgi:hypothetical protein